MNRRPFRAVPTACLAAVLAVAAAGGCSSDRSSEDGASAAVSGTPSSGSGPPEVVATPEGTASAPVDAGASPAPGGSRAPAPGGDQAVGGDVPPQDERPPEPPAPPGESAADLVAYLAGAGLPAAHPETRDCWTLKPGEADGCAEILYTDTVAVWRFTEPSFARAFLTGRLGEDRGTAAGAYVVEYDEGTPATLRERYAQALAQFVAAR